MNPWALLGGGALWLASLGAVGYWQNGAGVTAQKVVDQGKFDQITVERSQQKNEAAAILARANAETLALMAERDTLKTDLEKKRAENRQKTDALRDSYAGLSLRFRPDPPGAAGNGGGGPSGAAPDPAGTDPATGPTVQLPAGLTERLRRLAYDADQVLDDYRQCYPYAQQVR